MPRKKKVAALSIRGILSPLVEFLVGYGKLALENRDHVTHTGLSSLPAGIDDWHAGSLGQR